jgi:ubiquinone/menaquinone biosynthesis C-methylase UbiE
MSARPSVSDNQRTYLPAAGRDWALPLYDPLVRLLGGDAVRARLLHQAALAPRVRILDIGCGTGTLAAMIKRQHPDVHVVGLDPDPKALARAARKAARARAAIQFDRGFADALPYADASFDRVLSSFMFHHLPSDARPNTLREVVRVLAPGGSFHMVDFAHHHSRRGAMSRMLHSRHRLDENSEGRVLALMRQAGFAAVRKISDGSMLFGQIQVAYYEACLS